MSLSIAVSLHRLRLKTPPGPLGVLCEPQPLRQALWVEGGWRDQLKTTFVGGKSLTSWRAEMRAAMKLAEPAIITGHQVEFFHAGVLAKIIAADALAKSTGGSSLFAAVDSDTPHSTRLAATRLSHGVAQRVDVAIPGLEADVAMESQRAVPRGQWLDFFARVADISPDYDASALRIFADDWMNSGEELMAFVPAMSRGHEAVQEALGIAATPHIAISHFCETPAYTAFFKHIAANADRFAAVYNAAQAGYRVRHRVRNAQRPVPPLAIEDEHVELPFWVNDWAGRRQRLFVDRAGQFVLRGGSEGGAPTQQSLSGEESDPRRVRPRALTLTLFLRLFLADLFVHGIGGAKYDEITDEIASEFFGIAAAPMACVSATLSLFGEAVTATTEEVTAARRALRDLRHNPQRYVSVADATLAARRRELLREAARLRTEDRLNRVGRRENYKALRAVHDEMLAAEPWLASSLAQRVDAILARQRDDQLRADREAFYGLHSLSALRELSLAIRDATGA